MRAPGSPEPLEIALALPLPPGVDPFPWLAPQLGLPSWPPGDPRAPAFEPYLGRPELHPRLVAWSSARFAVIPFDWSAARGDALLRAEVRQAALRAATDRKVVLVFHWHDSTDEVDLPAAVTFRTSLVRGPRYLSSEHCMPAWTEGVPSAAPPRAAWSARPVVTFCGNVGAPGHSPLDLVRRLRRRVVMSLGRRHASLRALMWSDPYALRRAALRVLERSGLVEARFLRRDKFFGGAVNVDTSAWNVERLRQARREYQENLTSGDYVLCVRGAGNFSHRLFEAMAAGRVPVLVDTEGGLPWERRFPWASKIVIVPAHELSSLPGRLRAFHERLGPAGLADLQAELRRFHDEWLTPEGFFGRLALHFEPGVA